MEEKKLFKTGRWLAIIRVVFLSMFVLLFSYTGMIMMKDHWQGENVLSADTFGDYVYIDVMYASPPFASDSEGNKCIFVTTKDGDNFRDCMFVISERDFEKSGLKKLSENTIETAKDIPAVHVNAYLRESYQQLNKVAEKYYKLYIGDESLVNPFKYLGNFYLEYTEEGLFQRMDIMDYIVYVGLGILIGMCVMEIVQIIKKQKRKENKIALCKELYERDGEYAKGIREIDSPETIFYKGAKLYITPHYIVSISEGVEVFRIENIKELYGYDKSSRNVLMSLLFGLFAGYRVEHALAAVTSDNELHLFAKFWRVGKMHDEIVRKLIQKNPNILLGRKTVSVHELEQNISELKLSNVPGFYGNVDVWKGRVKETFIS